MFPDKDGSLCQSSTPGPSEGSPCLHTLSHSPALLSSLILGLRKKKKKEKKEEERTKKKRHKGDRKKKENKEHNRPEMSTLKAE